MIWMIDYSEEQPYDSADALLPSAHREGRMAEDPTGTTSFNRGTYAGIGSVW